VQRGSRFDTKNVLDMWCSRLKQRASAKKADIQRAYGRGPYRGDESPAHFFSGKQTVIQGPDSKTLKYDAFLCHQCNTATTQPFDKAYDQLICWIFAHEDKVLQCRLIDFEEVYGANFASQQTDLYKYFAKALGVD
jgi:hypothetical protein